MELSRLASLLAPYLPDAPPELLAKLSTYLDLLLKWNARTNLTAIRDPEQIVERHFGESLFAGRLLPGGATTLLDLGSGAGFPGMPIQLLHPEVSVTLAESQNKKATFLREVARTLRLSTDVHSGRAEELTRQFDVVTLRAVDRMERAVSAGWDLLAPGGTLLVLASSSALPEFANLNLVPTSVHPLPGASNRAVYLVQNVPRGTER